MPAGKTHEKINTIFLHMVIFGAAQVGSYLRFGMDGLIASLLVVSGYLFGTYCFGPDLDIKSRPFYRWGVFRFVWKPYQKMFHHRSFWTHGVLIGDIVRVVYLLPWLLIPYSAFYIVAQAQWKQVHEFLWRATQTHDVKIGCFLLGVVAASTLHIAADKWSSFFKRRKRKRRSR